MSSEKTSTVWVPTCCGRVMRYNIFRQADGGSLGSLVCTICSKNINLEQEPLTAVNTYGEGSSLLTVLGTPRPSKEDRRQNRGASSGGHDEPTL